MFPIDHLLDFIQVGPDHLLGVKGAPREDDLTLATTLARHRPHQRRPHDQDFVVVDVLAHRWYTGTGGVVAASRSSLYQMVLLHYHHHHHHHQHQHHHQLELGREFLLTLSKVKDAMVITNSIATELIKERGASVYRLQKILERSFRRFF